MTEKNNDTQGTEKMTKTTKSLEKPKPMLNFILMGAGSVFTSMIVSGFIVGYAFDVFFETAPIFMLLFGLLGFIGGAMKVKTLLMKMDMPKAKDVATEIEKKVKSDV